MHGAVGTFLRATLQILVITFALHQLIRLFRGTRSAQILLGVVVALIPVLFFTQWLHLDVLAWIFKWVLLYLAMASLVIFQPELRRALAQLGRHGFAQESKEKRKDRVELLAAAVERLSARRHGAIIAIARNDRLDEFESTATILDAPLQLDLLVSIFFPNAPLHDGGVIVNGDTIHAARCIFPLAEDDDPRLVRHGTRHRAALGLCEATDALVLVVSEETGEIRIYCEKHATRPLDPHNLRRCLAAALPAEVTEAWRFLLSLGVDDPAAPREDMP